MGANEPDNEATVEKNDDLCTKNSEENAQYALEACQA
jgi:hypothetical protein